MNCLCDFETKNNMVCIVNINKNGDKNKYNAYLYIQSKKKCSVLAFLSIVFCECSGSPTKPTGEVSIHFNYKSLSYSALIRNFMFASDLIPIVRFNWMLNFEVIGVVN